MRHITVALILVLSSGVAQAPAQTSSIGARNRTVDAATIPKMPPREAPQIPRNATYEHYSWITLRPVPPKKYKVGDLITIIVRERRRFEADADLETKTKFDILSELDAFLKFTDGGVGEATFTRGKPNVDFRFDKRHKTEGDTIRRDSLTMRLAGKIIDVKPNGLLVLEARARVQHDEEISTITLTGTCRKEDVTADNTVLSTQIAEKNVVVQNKGAIRDASTRGWIHKLLDLLKPF
jgi:flagellar L-ring protein precursor FlgH